MQPMEHILQHPYDGVERGQVGERPNLVAVEALGLSRAAVHVQGDGQAE